MLFNLWVVNKSGGLVYARELAPSGTRMSGNEALMGASTFHSLHAIAKQLAPVPSGGITAVEAPGFALHCFESPTGVKFFCTTRPGAAPAGAAPGFLRRVYEAYADYVLKNPFYELDMPIRVRLFDAAVDASARTAGAGGAAVR